MPSEDILDTHWAAAACKTCGDGEITREGIRKSGCVYVKEREREPSLKDHKMDSDRSTQWRDYF